MGSEITTRPTEQDVQAFLESATPAKRRARRSCPSTGSRTSRRAALLPSRGTYTEGAGRVYVRKLEDIDLDLLGRLIAIAWAREDDAAARPAAGPRVVTSSPARASNARAAHHAPVADSQPQSGSLHTTP
ncbi:hypothetical protein HNR16_000034 [Pseudoclavibacter chungangensis]|nr:hypothetical protein [Pseudoclavibacter chungangensis]